MLKKIIKPFYILLNEIVLMIFKGCRFENRVTFDRNCRFEGKNFISSMTYLRDVEMGLFSYTGYGCYLIGVKVGRFTSIGPCVKTAIGTHPTRNYVSTHPLFFSANPPVGKALFAESRFKEVKFAIDERKKYSIEIGNDVWIGANVTIIDGVTIGDGAIIGAGSLVLKDVDPYSIVVGAPAKEVRKRFEKEEIEYLLKLKWWNKNEIWIRANAEKFDKIEKLQGEVGNDPQ